MPAHASERRRAREMVAQRFRWIEGHADVWSLFHDGETFATLVGALAEPWVDANVTKVCGVEARGFLLGGAVAVRLGVGFAAVRKDPALFPGDKLAREALVHYRGVECRLLVQKDSLGPGDRVLLVDDWAEHGSQALASRHLIEECGASFLGVSVVVDQLSDDVRSQLGRVAAVVRYDELPTG